MIAPAVQMVVPGPLDQRTGGYRYDARIVEGLRTRGWRVDVHPLAGRFPLPDAVARRSAEAALRRIPDGARVLVDGLATAAVEAAVAAHHDRLQLLALVHHPLSDETGLPEPVRARLGRVEATVLSLVRGVVVTSPFTARGLDRFGVPAGRVRVVIPGTDPTPWAEGPAAGAPAALLAVGSVIPRKGYDVLVAALARLRDRRWRCCCAGSLDRDQPYAATVVRAAAAAGLTSRLTFVGECDHAALQRYYAAASIFVLPSLYEGYGMVFTEALARGLPIVSTTGGAIPETVPVDAGVLVPPGDDRALASAIDVFLDDAVAADDPRREGPPPRPRRLAVAGRMPPRPTRAACAAAARRHASALPSWAAAAAAMEDALLALAPSPGDAPGRSATGGHDAVGPPPSRG